MLLYAKWSGKALEQRHEGKEQLLQGSVGKAFPVDGTGRARAWWEYLQDREGALEATEQRARSRLILRVMGELLGGTEFRDVKPSGHCKSLRAACVRPDCRGQGWARETSQDTSNEPGESRYREQHRR